MKKYIILALIMVLVMSMVNAYSAYIVVTVRNISASATSGDCTGITGDNANLSIRHNCTCSDFIFGTSITEGQQVTSNLCSCNAGGQANITVSISETILGSNVGTVGELPSCVSGGSNQCSGSNDECVNFTGCTCFGNSYSFIGGQTTIDTFRWNFTTST